MSVIFGSPVAQRILARDKVLRSTWTAEMALFEEEIGPDPSLHIRESYRLWRKQPANERDLERGTVLRSMLLWCKRGQL